MKVGDRIQLKIDRLSYDGGRGVGRLNDFVFFVAGTAPEDEVEAEVIEIKKNFGFARLLTVTKASPHRRTAPCPVYEKCGGCVWQHVNYDEQLRQKRHQLAFALKKVRPLSLSQPELIPSPKEFHYRNRVQVHVANRKVGFFASGTNDLVEIEDCLIADERLFKKLDRHAAEFRRGRKVEIGLNESGARVLRNLSEEESVFTQVNTEQNEKLKSLVVELVDSPAAQVYDLFCGDGNLAFALLEAKPQVRLVGIEFSVSAVARANAKSTFESRAQFKANDVLEYLEGTVALAPQAVVIVDPPRAGLGPRICAEILRLKPARLVYVSCNLSTLARDLTVLTRDFEVLSVVGLDMFPQTEYIETVVALVPRASR